MISVLVSQDLRLVQDVHWQRRRHSFDDDSALRWRGLGGQLLGNTRTRSGLFAELTDSFSLTSVPLTDSSQSLSPSEAATVNLAQTPSISLSHARSRRSHPEAVVDLTLFPLLSVCLSLCLSLVVGFFFFFFLATIWVDLILVSNCGGWFAVEVGCSGGDGGFCYDG